MKKGLFIVLLVLLTLTMFISCDGSVNEKLMKVEDDLPQSVSFRHSGGDIITFDQNGGCILSTSPTETLSYNFNSNTLMVYYGVTPIITFFKGSGGNQSITSVEELFSLAVMYDFQSDQWTKQ